MYEHIRKRYLDYPYSKKVCYTTFRERVKRWIAMEDAIKYIAPKQKTRKESSPIWQYWDSYKWDKPAYNVFRTRVINLGRTFEEAIEPKMKVWYKAERYMKGVETMAGKWKTVKRISEPWYLKPKQDPNYRKIDITYTEEEAEVFRSAYQRMINEIELKLLNEEDTKQVIELNRKLKQLQWELQTFNLFNPIKKWH